MEVIGYLCLCTIILDQNLKGADRLWKVGSDHTATHYRVVILKFIRGLPASAIVGILINDLQPQSKIRLEHIIQNKLSRVWGSRARMCGFLCVSLSHAHTERERMCVSVSLCIYKALKMIEGRSSSEPSYGPDPNIPGMHRAPAAMSSSCVGTDWLRTVLPVFRDSLVGRNLKLSHGCDLPLVFSDVAWLISERPNVTY